MWREALSACLGATICFVVSAQSHPPVEPPPTCNDVAGLASLTQQVADLSTLVRSISSKSSITTATMPLLAPPTKQEPEGVSKEEQAPALTGSSMKVVESALERRRWSEDDRQELRLLLSTLPAPEGGRVLEALAAAINRRDVTVEFDGPPF